MVVGPGGNGCWGKKMKTGSVGNQRVDDRRGKKLCAVGGGE